jgi:ribosomal protein L37E
MKIVKCKDCGEEFQTSYNARYPRKYCDECGLERKKAYENIDKVKFEDCDDE